MKKIRNRSLTLLVVFCLFCVSLPTVVGAAPVQNTLMYSNDYFTGDSIRVNQIKGIFTREGYSATSISRPTLLYAVNSQIKNSKSSYVSTHGDSSGSKIYVNVQTGGNVYLTPSNLTTSISSKVVFYSACYSAKNNSNNVNLCAKTVTNGADVCLGYSQVVDYTESHFFETTFYEKLLSESVTAYAAYVFAKNATMAHCGSSSTAATSAKIYGNYNYVYS